MNQLPKWRQLWREYACLPVQITPQSKRGLYAVGTVNEVASQLFDADLTCAKLVTLLRAVAMAERLLDSVWVELKNEGVTPSTFFETGTTHRQAIDAIAQAGGVT